GGKTSLASRIAGWVEESIRRSHGPSCRHWRKASSWQAESFGHSAGRLPIVDDGNSGSVVCDAALLRSRRNWAPCVVLLPRTAMSAAGAEPDIRRGLVSVAWARRSHS